MTVSELALVRMLAYLHFCAIPLEPDVMARALALLQDSLTTDARPEAPSPEAPSIEKSVPAVSVPAVSVPAVPHGQDWTTGQSATLSADDRLLVRVMGRVPELFSAPVLRLPTQVPPLRRGSIGYRYKR
jgi:hypothetical protein